MGEGGGEGRGSQTFLFSCSELFFVYVSVVFSPLSRQTLLNSMLAAGCIWLTSIIEVGGRGWGGCKLQPSQKISGHEESSGRRQVSEKSC